MDIKDLRQRKADLLKEADTLIVKEDDKSITEDEATRLNAIMDDDGDLDTVNAAIVREEKLMEQRRSMTPVTDINTDTVTEAADKLLPATVKAAGQPFASFGEQMAAIANKAVNGVTDSRLPQYFAASGASEGVASDGGYLVQTDFSTELLRKAHEFGVFTGRVRQIPISSDANGLKINAIKETSRANGSRFGAVQAFWAGEAEALTASRPKFRQMELNLHKLTGLAYATDELLADAAALGTVLDMAFTEEFAFKLDNAIFEGSGAGEPLGVMEGGALVSVAKESGQAADTIVIENIFNIYARMWARSRANAVWYINQDIEPQLFGLTDASNRALWLPSNSVAGRPHNTLLGLPIVPTEHNRTLGDKGDITLFDLSQYLMIEKGPMQAASSIHVRFLNDEMTFRFIIRADGQPIWESALTPFAGTATKSPFVTLDARA